jgi:hypothetical protein
LSFEVSYSELITEAPKRNKFKKSEIKKEDYALTVSKTFHDQSITSCDFSRGQNKVNLCICTRGLERPAITWGAPPVGAPFVVVCIACLAVRSSPGLRKSREREYLNAVLQTVVVNLLAS